MKKFNFLPIIIIFVLAILVIWGLIRLRPEEEKVLKKASVKSTKLQRIIQQNIKSSEIKSTTNSEELLTAERVYTELELQNTTEIQFEEMLKDIAAKLPVLSDIKQLPSGALHHIPPVILEAGRNLGVIKEVLKFHPEFEEKTLPLYKQCALAENRPASVRALCLTNLIVLSRKNNLHIDLAKFPPNIVELTKLVTDM